MQQPEPHYRVNVTYPQTFYTQRLEGGKTLEVRITWRVNSAGISHHVKTGERTAMFGPSLIEAVVVTLAEVRGHPPTRVKLLPGQITLDF